MIRFEKKTKIDKETGCYLWIGSISGVSKTSSGGYGVTSFKNKNITIHRLAAHLFLNFDLNSNLQINHKIGCNNRNCWNPEHLYIGTQEDNIRDAIVTGSLIPGQHQRDKTHCSNGHEFTEENTRYYGTERKCRICSREHNLAYNQGRTAYKIK